VNQSKMSEANATDLLIWTAWKNQENTQPTISQNTQFTETLSQAKLLRAVSRMSVIQL